MRKRRAKGALGPQYEVFSSIRLCVLAALSEDWEDAYAHAKKLKRAGCFSMRWIVSTSITRSKRCCEEETKDAPEKRSVVSPSAPRRMSEIGCPTCAPWRS